MNPLKILIDKSRPERQSVRQALEKLGPQLTNAEKTLEFLESNKPTSMKKTSPTWVAAELLLYHYLKIEAKRTDIREYDARVNLLLSKSISRTPQRIAEDFEGEYGGICI